MNAQLSEPKQSIGQGILDGIREIKRGEHARVRTAPSVQSIRERVSACTLQEWEQGRRAPSGAARTLLRIAERNPRVLLDVAWAATSPAHAT
jgi:putative transcriptional regulator